MGAIAAVAVSDGGGLDVEERGVIDDHFCVLVALGVFICDRRSFRYSSTQRRKVVLQRRLSPGDLDIPVRQALDAGAESIDNNGGVDEVVPLQTTYQGICMRRDRQKALDAGPCMVETGC